MSFGRVVAFLFVTVTVGGAGCTKSQAEKCTSDSDCKDSTYPFCDVNGEYPASDGQKNVCTTTPQNCPVARCGCSAGAARCENDMLVTCDPGGMSETSQQCSLGCGGATSHCLGFVPLNGLDVALTSAGSAADVSISDGSTINTDTGVVTNAAHVPVTVPSVVVGNGGTSIRVFYGHEITIGSVTINGQAALGIASATTMSITGTVNASASNATNGPGAVASNSACVGTNGTAGTGGGNATAGGNGYFAGAVGAMQGSLDSSGLIGGCAGGSPTDGSGTPTAPGGGGGGAIQLVAGTSVTFAATALVNAGGGGGPPLSGGGAGGNIIVEAPSVAFEQGADIAANGGGGGACGVYGADAHTNSTAAAGGGPCGTPPQQPVNRGGAGGTGLAAATNAANVGGGGGAVGRLYVRTQTGQVDMSAAQINAAATTGSIAIEH